MARLRKTATRQRERNTAKTVEETEGQETVGQKPYMVNKSNANQTVVLIRNKDRGNESSKERLRKGLRKRNVAEEEGEQGRRD